MQNSKWGNLMVWLKMWQIFAVLPGYFLTEIDIAWLDAHCYMDEGCIHA